MLHRIKTLLTKYRSAPRARVTGFGSHKVLYIQYGDTVITTPIGLGLVMVEQNVLEVLLTIQGAAGVNDIKINARNLNEAENLFKKIQRAINGTLLKKLAKIAAAIIIGSYLITWIWGEDEAGQLQLPPITQQAPQSQPNAMFAPQAQAPAFQPASPAFMPEQVQYVPLAAADGELDTNAFGLPAKPLE